MPIRKPTADEISRFRNALANNKPIEAILIFRQVTGADLRNAKEVVDFCRGLSRALPKLASELVSFDPADWLGTGAHSPSNLPRPGTPSRDDLDRFHTALRNRNTIDAIKIVREVTSCGLAEAKQFVDFFKRQIDGGGDSLGQAAGIQVSDWLPQGEGEPPLPPH